MLCGLLRKEYICIIISQRQFMQFFDYIISHYGWQGVALASCILVLFFVQLYYQIGVYGRISRFRNSRRKKILESEPPISIVVPLFSEDYRYLEESLPLIMDSNTEPHLRWFWCTLVRIAIFMRNSLVCDSLTPISQSQKSSIIPVSRFR